MTTNIPTSTLVNAVSHLLGRPIQGWIIINKSNAAIIWRADESNPVAPERLLNLLTDTDVTVDIYVF